MAAEAVASGTAPELAQAMSADLEFDAKIVHQLAMQGDAAAREIFRRFGTALGIALAGLINIFNLPMYVIGGGVASAWEAFAPAMLETARSYSYVYRVTANNVGGATGIRADSFGKGTVITRALLGSDAGLIGAARLPMTEKLRAAGS